MKYTFFHFTRWNKSHIHDKHLNILYLLHRNIPDEYSLELFRGDSSEFSQKFFFGTEINLVLNTLACES